MHQATFGRPSSRLLTLTFAVMWAGCTGAPETDAPQTGKPDVASTADSETQSVKTEALTIGISRNAIAYDYGSLPDLVHSAAGDERFVFVPESLTGRVAVLDRLTGEDIGSVTPPPAGFQLPFSVRVPSTGRLAVLDPGGFPNPVVASIPKIYEYNYTYNHRTKAITFTLARTISFAGLPVIFTEDFDVLPNGGYAVSESIIGAIWVVAPNGAITPGLLPASFNPADEIPAIGPCGFTPITIAGVPFTTGGNFAPGVGALANRNGQLYFGSTCTGGVSRIPIASLTDSRAPYQRAADIVQVTARAPGVVEETLHGLAFNRWDPNDNRLYASDSIARRIIRINTTTGARETLSDNTNLFDFPVGLQFLPPVDGLSPLVVASDQEYRLAALNPAIPTDQLHPPFVVAKVYILK